MNTPFRMRTWVLALSLFIGCTGSGSDDTDRASTPEISEYDGQGRIVRILENSRLIQIEHSAIEGFMSAMTMPFEYRADSIRNAVEVGDSVHFRVASDGIDNWIVQIQAIE